MTKSGILIINGKTIQIKYDSKFKTIAVTSFPKEWQTEFTKNPTSLNNRSIDFDEDKNGRITNMRLAGTSPASAQIVVVSTSQTATFSQSAQRSLGDFHNPYNFVPMLDRDLKHPDLGDAHPISHDRFHVDRISGVLRVRLTTETPLLIPNTAKPTFLANDHRIFSTLVDHAEKPKIPSTSVKGMLRSAYEAITNSRLGVFVNHDDRLGFRPTARSGTQLVPCRIEHGSSGLEVRLLPGNTSYEQNGRPIGREVFAAWLPMYRQHRRQWKYQPIHGQTVWAYITPWKHQRFDFWNVVEIEAYSPQEPNYTPNDNRRPRWNNATPKNSQGMWIKGYVCITNQNIDRKHDERIFFAIGQTEVVPLSDSIKSSWRSLINNYHDTSLMPGAEQDTTKRSRHVNQYQLDRELKHGDLAYAEVSHNRVVGLYPVMISRKLYEISPHDCLPDSLKPASKKDQLSATDRVFGWVNQQGDGAFQGNVRISPITCVTTDAIQALPQPLPLAILGQPKPQQARFYLGDHHGRSQGHRQPKTAVGYVKGRMLRGRKVYPHHAELPPAYWDTTIPQNEATAKLGGRHQEYRNQSADNRTDQNRSITDWVRPKAEFTFEIQVTNLSQFELGALLFLLRLPANHFHRLGGGKPLGFGSVQLSLSAAELRTGAEWKGIFQSLEPLPQSNELLLADCESIFKQVVEREFPKDRSPVLAFLQAAKGFSKPIHYPRNKNQLPNEESFKWFVANEKDPDGSKQSLDNLIDDKGLLKNSE